VRHRIIALAAAALLVTGLVAAAQPVYASSVSRSALVSPTFELCQADTGLCMNRSQGGFQLGTQVISWTENDPNNDFEWLWLSQYCGTGHITPTCPNFHNSNINKVFNGAPAVAAQGGVDKGSPLYCLALNGLLNYCPAPDGSCPKSGQCIGTVFFLINCGDFFSCFQSAMLNYYWTVRNGSVSYVKIPLTIGQRVIIGYKSLQTVYEYHA
jgi:hypothetical protein